MTESFSKKQKILLGAICLSFFFLTSILAGANLFRPEGVHPHFDWPDETMNAFFAERFATHGTLSTPLFFHTPHDVVRPRSFNVYNGTLVPGGFLGLPLMYGDVIAVFGLTLPLFIPSLLGMLALLALAFIIKSFFGTKTALLATFFAAFHPAILYYASYSYLPNIPFVAFLVFGALFFLYATSSTVERHRRGWSLATGLSVGIALTIRSNEALWVIAAFAIPLLASKKCREWKNIALIMLGVVLCFLPILYFQQKTFGGAFVTGYSRFVDAGIASPTEFGTATSHPLAVALRALTFPYGFHPRVVWYNISRSFLFLAPWASIPALIAFCFFVAKRKKTEGEKFFLAIVILVSVWLFASYGSWMLSDPLVLALNTIGVSHVRYWLPLSFFSAVLIGLAVSILWERGRAYRWTAAAFCLFYALCSFWLAYFQSPESIAWVAKRIVLYNHAAAAVVAHTEPNAIVLTERTDKEIFPERLVTTDLVSGGKDVLSGGACLVPLYAYIAADEPTHLNEVLSSVLIQNGNRLYALEEVVQPRPGFSLWKIALTPEGKDLCDQRNP